MPTSQNGWSASPSLALRPFVVNGEAFPPGIRDNNDVATVLGYVMTQFDKRVEPLRNPGCWGYSYRANRNDPNSLSNHSSGTAVDANAPAHPNGVPTLNTFTVAQASEIHRILAEVDGVVRWGGDYNSTPDSMHFEINAGAVAVAATAARLRQEEIANMPLNDADKKWLADTIRAELTKAGDTIKVDNPAGGAKRSLSAILGSIYTRQKP